MKNTIEKSTIRMEFVEPNYELMKERKKEFKFFIKELEKLGKQGVRPWQAFSIMESRIKCNKKSDSTTDRFYWEGVYQKGFDYKKEKKDG